MTIEDNDVEAVGTKGALLDEHSAISMAIITEPADPQPIIARMDSWEQKVSSLPEDVRKNILDTIGPMGAKNHARFRRENGAGENSR